MKVFGQNWVILCIYHTTSEYHGGLQVLGTGVNSVIFSLTSIQSDATGDRYSCTGTDTGVWSGDYSCREKRLPVLTSQDSRALPSRVHSAAALSFFKIRYDNVRCLLTTYIIKFTCSCE